MKVIYYQSSSDNRWYIYNYYKDGSLEMDDTEELNQHMDKLRKSNSFFNSIVYCFDWSTLEMFGKTKNNM